jgi:branched-chain amino acid transport system substrate-binding protein
MSMRARSLVVAVALPSLVLVACGSRVDAPPPAPSGATTSQAVARNTASDVGVTPTSIKIGSIAGLTSGLGPDTFSASLYGAKAYFAQLNEKGGVNGRQVEFVPCDDQGANTGNVGCARKLVDDDKVFALAGVTAFDYAGAQFINSKGVPDVGGQPVGTAYDTYPHLYSIYGSIYPRDGKRPGYNGTLYAGTENYRWFHDKLNARTAGVVYYNVAPSQRYAQSIIDGLKREGFTVVEEQINLGLPNWDAAVLDMRNRGVEVVYDAMEDGGNSKLCQAIQTQRLNIKAKVTTAQGWTQNAGNLYRETQACRDVLYATSSTANYDDPSIPAVAEFRAAATKFTPDREGKINMWMLEGWASAKWLTDAMASCGANLTRSCVEEFVKGQPYDGGGLLVPRSFTPSPQPPASQQDCFNVGRWQDSANGGKGGWTSQVPDMKTNCYDVPYLPYPAG